MSINSGFILTPSNCNRKCFMQLHVKNVYYPQFWNTFLLNLKPDFISSETVYCLNVQRNIPKTEVCLYNKATKNVHKDLFMSVSDRHAQIKDHEQNNSKLIILDTFQLYLVIAINALHTSYYIPVQKCL